VELTAKKWKALQLVGTLVGLIGIVLIVAGPFNSEGRWSSQEFVIGFIVACGGGVIGVIGTIGAWWHHG
jgi:hypothetical protein